LVAAAATTINVAGDAKFTATGNTTGAVTAINVTNTAGAVFGTAIGTGVTFTGGAGADGVVLTTGYTKAISMGAGNDTVTYAGARGTGGSIAGGDGTDTVKMTTALALAADDSSAFNTYVTGFEKLELSDANTTGDVIDLDGINGVDQVKLSAAVTGTLTLNNIGSGGTVTVTTNGAATPILVAGVAGALSGSADSLNIVLSKSSAILAAGQFTVANVETVNFNTADAATAGSDAVVHTATLVATGATSVVVAGNNGLNLTNTGNTAITSFDASGVVGNSTVATPGVAATTDSAANLAVTFVSANTTATAVVTITGGAGDDTLTGVAAKDTINGGAGADSITGGTGIDTLTGGAGVDTFNFAAGDAGITGTERITDYTIGTTADNLNLSTTTLVANVTASDVSSVISGSTDLKATITTGIITLSGADAAMVDTLGEWKLVFEALEDAAAADVAAFVYAGNTYVITDAIGAAANDIIQLTGLTTATKLVTTAAAGGILIS
jgi:S-layer protein